jgi:hypothetical protein
MPFPEAILKLAKFHSLKPEYYSPKEKETPDEKITNGSDSLLTS